MVAAPASAHLRQLKFLSVYNADTATATVTVRVNDGGSARVVTVVALLAGYRLEYAPDSGFRVLSDTGAFVGIGPIDGLLHVSQISDEYLAYDEDGQMMGHSMTQSTAGEAGHEGHEGH